jgi:classical protein kinase C beta type
VLCYEFLVGDSPFEADDDEELFNQILTSKVMFPAKLAPAAKDFVNALLDRNPSTRLGCGPNGKETVRGCSRDPCTLSC